jgi:DNA repair photolyase
MSLNSHIEWTDATWNPVRGCIKISPGCKHCYAETFAERFRGVKGHPYEQGFDLRLVPEKPTEPFAWRSPKLVFVNSMSDLFQPGVPDAYTEAVSRVMATADWHTYQVLTKRSERLREFAQWQAAVRGGERKHLVGCKRRRSEIRIAPNQSSSPSLRESSLSLNRTIARRPRGNRSVRYRVGHCWRREWSRRASDEEGVGHLHSPTV